MVVDFSDDPPIRLQDAAKLFPRPPGTPPPCVTTMWKYHAKGIRGVRLQTWFVGGKKYTTAGAVAAFIAALNAPAATGTTGA